VAGQLPPQQLHELGIGVPLGVGDVLNVHIHAVQVVPLHSGSDLAGQLLPVVQGGDALGPVPVVAQKGHHLHIHGVHGGDEGGDGALVVELQGAAVGEIEVAGGDLIQGASGLLYSLDIG